MVDKINVELDESFLKKFFGLTDRMIPEDQEVTMAMLRKQLDEIASALKEASEVHEISSEKPQNEEMKVSSSSSSISQFGDSFDDDLTGRDTFNLPKKSILIIDDLGVITYQLSVLFKQLGFETGTSKEIYDAIEKFKKQNFDIVLMDLFIPTEREGFILLEELKKIAAAKQANVRIGIMSASTKREHKQLCKIKGAEFYLEKVDDWQKELLNMIKGII